MLRWFPNNTCLLWSFPFHPILIVYHSLTLPTKHNPFPLTFPSHFSQSFHDSTSSPTLSTCFNSLKTWNFDSKGLLEEAYILEALRRRFCCTYNSGRQSRDIFAGRSRRWSFVCRFSIFLGLGPLSCPSPSH